MAPKKEKRGPSKASKDRAARATRRELAKQTPVAMEAKRARLETSLSNLDNDQDGDTDGGVEGVESRACGDGPRLTARGTCATTPEPR